MLEIFRCVSSMASSRDVFGVELECRLSLCCCCCCTVAESSLARAKSGTSSSVVSTSSASPSAFSVEDGEFECVGDFEPSVVTLEKDLLRAPAGEIPSPADVLCEEEEDMALVAGTEPVKLYMSVGGP